MKKIFKTILLMGASVGAMAQPAYTSTNQNLSGANIVRIDSDPSADRSQPLADQSNISVGSVSAEIATKAGVFMRISGTHMMDTSAIDRSDFNDITTVGDEAAVYLGKFHPLTVASYANNVWAPGFDEYDAGCNILKGRQQNDGSFVNGDEYLENDISANILGTNTSVYSFSGMVNGFGCRYYEDGQDVKVQVRFMTAVILDQYSGPEAVVSIGLREEAGTAYSQSHRIVDLITGRFGQFSPAINPVADATFFNNPPSAVNATGVTTGVILSETTNKAYMQMILNAEFSLEELIQMTQSGSALEDVYASTVAEYDVSWQYNNI